MAAETTIRCEKCGWAGLAKLEPKHRCDRAYQERQARRFWETVGRDLDRRAGGR